jgi:Lysine methyltransferase
MLLYLGHNDWDFDPPFLDNLQSMNTILELGAGTGMVTSGIVETVATCEQNIVISTDLPEVCPLLEANLRETLNRTRPRCCTVRVRPLTWGNAHHAIEIGKEFGLAMSAVDSYEPRYLTHIVCSDLVCTCMPTLIYLLTLGHDLAKVYFPELLAPLLRTLIQLSSPPFIPTPESRTSEHGLKIVMSYKIRSLAKEAAFFSAFGLWFAFEPVIARPNPKKGEALQSPWSRFGTSLDGQDFIFVARRRPESMTWGLPDDDQKLLDGVGAWGTDSRKSDDTFEMLLLMGLDDEDNNK